jgi:hypothetical protein
MVLAADEQVTSKGYIVKLSAKVLQATPNHPMITLNGKKKMSDVTIGDEVICYDRAKNTYRNFTVFNKHESASGMQNVYNMQISSGSTFIMNGVMVMQK